jgi:hypothetical protein
MKTEAPTIWELESEAELLSPRAVAAVVIGVLISLYAIALLLIARRAMGAFTAELAWQVVLAAALMSFAAISGLRILWRRTFPESLVAKPQAAVDAWIGWGASLTLVLIAGGVSFPRGESQDWMLWVPVLVADQVLRRRLFEGREPTEPFITKPQAMGRDQLQQIVRTRDVAGHETVAATLRADFVTGQRNATVYLGFCPPLARVPEIEITPVDGAEVKIVQAFAHGARIDVRLARVATEAKSIFLNVNAQG